MTPREIERCFGFPDDYTLVPYRKGMMADGPRYKALGNSMAVPVMRWIGQRIAMVESLPRAENLLTEVLTDGLAPVDKQAGTPENAWLGREDSNLRMTVPKTDLPPDLPQLF